MVFSLMDPEKIRENMRRLSSFGEGLKKKPTGPAKPRWTPLPGEDLADDQKRTEQEELAREIGRKSEQPAGGSQKPPVTKNGPRGGRYTEDRTKDGRPYRRYF